MQTPPLECKLCPAGEVLSARMELSLSHLRKASDDMQADLKTLLLKTEDLNNVSIHLSEEISSIRQTLSHLEKWREQVDQQSRRLDEHIAVSSSQLRSHQVRSAAFGAGGGVSLIGILEFLKWLFLHIINH